MVTAPQPPMLRGLGKAEDWQAQALPEESLRGQKEAFKYDLSGSL